jgi:primosomal protein N' (replication factor Y)
MAIAKPLRLKSQSAPRPVEQASASSSIAQVWVDSGVFHLDQLFDYLIPARLDALVSPGVRVIVPFHGRDVEALVRYRIESSQQGGLKTINKVISSIPVATEGSLALIDAVAKRWAAHPFDVIRSAIPPRAASVEKNAVFTAPALRKRQKPKRTYKQLPASRDAFELISTFVQKSLVNGSVLVLLPDTRSITRFAAHFTDEVIVLDSSQERTERYANFLTTLCAQSSVIVGTRSAIFAPVDDLSQIVIYDEASENFYEQRSPGWNVRDVAFLRSSLESTSLTFFGYSPSSEVARAIDIGWISFESIRDRILINTFQQDHGELLPPRIFTSIRKALSQGPVLFLAPRKGYSQAVMCSKCRNVALCECGGKLSQQAPTSTIECVHCQSKYPDWRCSWCDSTTPFLLGRGADRFAHEIGSAFTGFAVTVSAGESILDSYTSDRGIVIATPGAAPYCPQGYSAVVILEGDRLLSQADIRSQERARSSFFATCALLRKGGEALLVISHASPLVGALAAWKPSHLSQRELRDRLEVLLPPYSRAVSLEIDTVEVQQLFKALEKSLAEGRLPSSSRLLGPTPTKPGKSRILILTSLEQGDEMIELIHEFQRKRSMAKKTLASLRIDPYSLSR